METRLLVLVSTAVLLASVLLAVHLASAATPVIAVAVNSTNVSLSEASSVLTPLTKIDCGDAVAVVYGPEQGRPVAVIIYAMGDGWRSDLQRCVNGLEACLASAGAEAAARELQRYAERLASSGHRVEVQAATLRVASQAATETVTATTRVEVETVATTTTTMTTAAATVAARAPPGKASPGAAAKPPSPGAPLSQEAAAKGATESLLIASERRGEPTAGLRAAAVLLAASLAAAVAMLWAKRRPPTP